MCDQKKEEKLQKSLDEAELDSLSASDDSESEEQEVNNTPFDPEAYSSSDEDEDEFPVIAPPAGQRAKSVFSLKGGGSDFSDRSHSIFDCLDSAAKLASSALGQDNVIDGVFARPLPPVASSKGRILVSSCATPAKKAVPDYVAHPERWTHYSLEDVAETSDRTNRAVAQEFLASLQKKKEGQESSSPVSCSTKEKIIFSKPCRSGREQNPEESSAQDKNKKMHLSHLKEEEDEEGRERGRTGRKRMHGCIEKRETAKSLSHLEEEDQEKKAIRRPDAEEGEGKEGKKAGKREKLGSEMEEEEEEKKVTPQFVSSFVSFKKTNRKNYRKNCDHDDR
ncbi:U5 small nuclear ribonucleoprotein TSSC4 [Genypterus blacodes]|uniref:U5 small nuclear ribonucleoprotein TSSC4 n=1 Tax=Genypterus blacodes TaxID=154954 RepID=UPI003F766707